MARQHGTRSCYVGGCRLDQCIEANREYMRADYRIRRARRGTTPEELYFVDPKPVIDHIAWLRSQGMGCPAIAKFAGLRKDSVREIALGRRQRITTRVADLLLGVPPVPEWVPVDGTARRIQAMAALGHNLSQISEDTGIARRHLSDITGRKVQRVRRSTYLAVVEAYRNRSMSLGSSEQVRVRSEGKQWAPPLAWDDDVIDDPEATPVGVRSPDQKVTLDLDDWLHLVRNGEHPERAAARFEMKLDSVLQHAQRDNRLDEYREAIEISRRGHVRTMQRQAKVSA